MTEYVFKIYTDENGVNFKSPKDLQPSEKNCNRNLSRLRCRIGRNIY